MDQSPPPVPGFLRALLARKTDNTLIQLFRYAGVSAISLVVDFSGLYFFTEIAGFHYLVSAAVSYSLGLAVNYLLSVLWVFPFHRLDNRSLEVAVFVIIGVLGLGLNELLLWLFTEALRFHYLVSRLLSAVVGYFWKFFARKLLLFRSRSSAPPFNH